MYPTPDLQGVGYFFYPPQREDTRYGDTRYKIENASLRMAFRISCISYLVSLYLTVKLQFKHFAIVYLLGESNGRASWRLLSGDLGFV